MNRDQEKAMFANNNNRNKGLTKANLSPETKKTIGNISGRRLKYTNNSTRNFWDEQSIENRKIIANTNLMKQVQKEFDLSDEDIAKSKWRDLSPAVRGYLEAQINGWETDQWIVRNDEDKKEKEIVHAMAHLYKEQKDFRNPKEGITKEEMKKLLKEKGFDPILVDYVVYLAHAKSNGKLDFSMGWFENDPTLRY